MKRAFVRTLWGESSVRKYGRRLKMNNDIKLLLRDNYRVPFKTYVFGQDNFDYLVDLGFDCKLINKDPYLWKGKIDNYHQYGHKLLVLREALKDYDEIVFLDWDCMAVRDIPDDFWDEFYKKEVIQASMRTYKRTVAYWRKKDKRKRACASFVYIRDKKLAADMFTTWKREPLRAEEQIISKYADEMIGGWQGVQAYWDKFEPNYFLLEKGEIPFYPYSYDLLESKEIVFLHFNKSVCGTLLGGANKHFQTEEEKNEFVSRVMNCKSYNMVLKRGQENLRTCMARISAEMKGERK